MGVCVCLAKRSAHATRGVIYCSGVGESQVKEKKKVGGREREQVGIEKAWPRQAHGETGILSCILILHD